MGDFAFCVCVCETFQPLHLVEGQAQYLGSMRFSKANKSLLLLKKILVLKYKAAKLQLKVTTKVITIKTGHMSICQELNSSVITWDSYLLMDVGAVLDVSFDVGWGLQK